MTCANIKLKPIGMSISSETIEIMTVNRIWYNGRVRSSYANSTVNSPEPNEYEAFISQVYAILVRSFRSN